MIRAARLVLAAGLVAALAGTAGAATGVVTGTLEFKQEQGNYCPNLSEPSRSCTGARYLETTFLSWEPIKHVKVFVKNNANGSTIGQGSTDTSGNFTIQWSSSASVADVTIYWVAEHKDGRFYITDMSSTKRKFDAWANRALTDGTTTSSPQNFGLRGWGGSHSAAIIANVNDGAWRMWTDSLSASSLMVNGFNNLKIMTFTTDPNDCPTSCAHGSSNYIKLNSGAQYQPQARIMHEMGHIAAYKTNAHVTTSDYCYPSTGGGCGWSMAEAEWQDPEFEEGFATFLGDRALYWQSSTAPFTCLSSGYCATNFNTETSIGSSCDYGTAKHHRQPIQVVRFLRDLYDTAADTALICNGDICVQRTDNISRSFFAFFDIFHAYPSCFGDHCDDEPWEDNWLGQWYIDDRDGRDGSDFKFRFEAETGVNATDPYALNCEP